MAEFTTSPNMSLPIPIVGVASGPAWATLLDSCLTLIDSHSHVAGSGVPITPAAINVNTDLTFISNNATNMRSLRFAPQSAPIAAAADLGCLYESGVDLYYNDGNGSQVRVTQAGALAGAAGTITGLPNGTASASYVALSSTFVWQSATNIAASMDFGSAILRNTSPNSTFSLTLSPPAALATNYALTLPSLPVTTRILSVSSSGVIAPGISGAIVTADLGTQQITQDKLALRTTGTTVAAGGVATSASCNTFTNATNTYQNVTNLSVTITTTGRPVMLLLQSDGISASGATIAGNSGGSTDSTINIKALRDSTTVGIQTPDFSVSSGVNCFVGIPSSSIIFLDSPAAGTYTYKIQAKAVQTGGAAQTCFVLNTVLVAYEI